MVRFADQLIRQIIDLIVIGQHRIQRVPVRQIAQPALRVVIERAAADPLRAGDIG